MAGGVAIFDYNRDGRPDIFFTNGGNIATLKKDSPKYRNRLFRNDGNGVFTDVTEAAGLAGTGYDIGAVVGDYDNDGYPDLFVAGVYHNTLYHNNGDGTFTDVTAKAGLDLGKDPDYGPLWAISGAWVDVNNDGLLDLFCFELPPVALQRPAHVQASWDPRLLPSTILQGPAQSLFLNQGAGTFKDVSAQWGIRQHVGKGMGVGVAITDQDGRPDLL